MNGNCPIMSIYLIKVCNFIVTHVTLLVQCDTCLYDTFHYCNFPRRKCQQLRIKFRIANAWILNTLVTYTHRGHRGQQKVN